MTDWKKDYGFSQEQADFFDEMDAHAARSQLLEKGEFKPLARLIAQGKFKVLYEVLVPSEHIVLYYISSGICYLAVWGIFLTLIIRAYYWLKTGESIDIDIKSLPSFNPEFWRTDNWEGVNKILTRLTDCGIEILFLLSMLLRRALAFSLYLITFLFILIIIPVAILSHNPQLILIPVGIFTLLVLFIAYKKARKLGLRGVLREGKYVLIVVLSTAVLALLLFLLKWIRDS